MLTKILRTAIGLPFVLMIYPSTLTAIPIMWLFYFVTNAAGGWNEDDTKFAKISATLPYQFIKKVWK